MWFDMLNEGPLINGHWALKAGVQMVFKIDEQKRRTPPN